MFTTRSGELNPHGKRRVRFKLNIYEAAGCGRICKLRGIFLEHLAVLLKHQERLLQKAPLWFLSLESLWSGRTGGFKQGVCVWKQISHSLSAQLSANHSPLVRSRSSPYLLLCAAYLTAISLSKVQLWPCFTSHLNNLHSIESLNSTLTLWLLSGERQKLLQSSKNFEYSLLRFYSQMKMNTMRHRQRQFRGMLGERQMNEKCRPTLT